MVTLYNVFKGNLYNDIVVMCLRMGLVARFSAQKCCYTIIIIIIIIIVLKYLSYLFNLFGYFCMNVMFTDDT